MVRSSPPSRLFILFLVFLTSCVDGRSPVNPGFGGMATLLVVPTFSSTAASAAFADAQPITNIRATVTVDPPGRVILTENFVVNPNDSEWEISLSIELTADVRAQYLIEIELLNDGGGTEWSGSLGPVSISGGVAPEIRELDVVRGPLGNLSVTSLGIRGPESVLDGGAFSLIADVTTSDGSAATVFWSSLDPAVASVDEFGAGVALQPGLARIQAIAGASETTHEIDVIGPPTGVLITPGSLVLTELGETADFTGTVVDVRGVATGDAVVWSVADDRVLSDLGGGSFEAIGGGMTMVEATAVGHPLLMATAEVNVDLTPVEVSIEPAETLLDHIGATAALVLTGRDMNGTVIFGLRGTWTSSAPSVVAVDDDGVVSGLAPGEATITADVNGVGAEAMVTVDPVVHSITLTPLVATLTATGQTQQFTAVPVDAGGTVVPGAPLDWASGNAAVATVDADGLATANGDGEAAINASSGGVRATANLQVNLAIDRVEVRASRPSLFVSEEVSFTATAYDAAGMSIPSATFEWETSDSEVLIIFSRGVGRGASPGVATVTATARGGVFGEEEVMVERLPPPKPKSLGLVVVSNTGDDDVEFFDLNAGTQATYSCEEESCNDPRNLRVNNEGTYAAVPFRHSDEVGIFDLRNPGFVHVLDDSSFNEPYAVAWSEDGSELWVANKDGDGCSIYGSISIVSMASKTVVHVMLDSEFDSPEGLAIGSGLAFVANRQGGSVTIISVAGRSVVRDVSLGGDPRDAAPTPDGAYVYVTTDSRNVKKVRVSDGHVTNIPLISGWSRNIAMAPDGKKVFVATQNGKIAVIDVATDVVREIAFSGGDQTYGVAILRDGSLGFVTDRDAEKVYMFDPKGEVEIFKGSFPASVGDDAKGITAH